MSLKATIREKLENEFDKARIKEIEDGFKVNSEQLNNCQIRLLNAVKDCGTISVNVKRSGTGLVVLIDIME